MGLLDDAIREHLDLKRRRGADPDEVQRAEREALGPVRRGPESAEPLEQDDADLLEPELDASAELEHLPAFDHEEEPDWGDAPDGGLEQPPPAPAAAGRPGLTPERPQERPSPPIEEFEDDELEFTSDPERHSPNKPLGDETAEYNVEEALENESDDMLEETPEFLQDTPDHDRLWFEQKPPRDFRFDG